MAYHSHGDFAEAAGQAQYGLQLSPASSMAERKASAHLLGAGFVSPPQEWRDMTSETRNVADDMNDLALGHRPAMANIQFKTEQGWSPRQQPAAYPHGNELDPMMSDYTPQSAHAHVNLQYNPNAHQHTAAPATNNLGTMTTIPHQGSYPMSPQAQAWLPTPTTEAFDFSPLAPQSSRHTPLFASSTSILRRDGVRKKNARFEIPAERNLRTIDQLIAQTADETEIKELKQQKRLLRNRQAALDSRQRKKQHTERLEEEKKQYSSIINELEDDVNALKIRESEWLRQRDEWMQRQAHYQTWIGSLQAEKEDLLRHHTNETAELRKENALLLEQLQKIDNVNLSAPGSAGLPTEFSDFEQLTIQNNPWDHFAMHDEFSVEAGPSVGNALGPMAKTTHASTKREDKAPAPGLLLMLLLCGAWVISRSSSSNDELLPVMPEELRVASATVIEDLYKGSGIRLPDPDRGAHSLSASTASEADGQQWRSSITYNDHGTISGAAHGPGLQQSDAQPQHELFSTSLSQHHNGQHSGSDSRQMASILRDAMHSMNAQGTVPADSYTKSLLLDKVPDQVLKDFAQMIAQGRSHKQDTAILEQQQPTYT